MRYRWIWCLVLVLPAVMNGLAASAQPEATSTAAAEAPQMGEWNSLASPRDTMFMFLEAKEQGALNGNDDAVAKAVKTLDLSKIGEVDEDRQHDLIVKLAGIIDRLKQVEPSDLPDAEEVREKNWHHYLFFPTENHLWVWKELADTAPDGRIELEETAPGQWQFSAETIAGLDSLHDSMNALPPMYKPTTDVGGLLGETFQSTPWWNWCTLLGCLFLGIAIGTLVQTAMRKRADRLERERWEVRAVILRDAASPVNLAIVTTGVCIGLRFIHLESRLEDFAVRVQVFLYLIAAGWFLFNLVDLIDLILRQLTERTESKLDNMIVPLVRKTLRIFLVIVFSIVVLQNVFELNITGFLASLGIAGLAVSLAAQDSIKNFFGSVTLFFDKPFSVGQVITLDGHTGKVEEIGFRSTRLRLFSGNLMTIPNMKVTDAVVENISVRPSIRREINITITYDTPVEKVERAVRIVRDILNDPQIVDEGKFEMESGAPIVSFDNFNADSLNIKAIYWFQYARDPERTYCDYLAHAEKINLMLLRAFAEEGIEFAFPTRTLYLAGDPNRKLAVEAKLSRKSLPSTPEAPVPQAAPFPSPMPRMPTSTTENQSPRRIEPKRTDLDRGEGGKAYT